jgi:SAM-dependent methyltransferase
VSQWSGVDDGLDYESQRAEWPSEVQTFLRGVRPSGAIRTAVDLGAGTGKLTRHLAAVASDVIAVDPVPQLLAVLHERIPQAHTVVGYAEAIPLPDASADAVAVGNAFHWFDADVAAAETARVLRPGGIVAIFWNRPRWPDWFDELGGLLQPYRNPTADAAADRAETGAWRKGLERRFGNLSDAGLGTRRHAWSLGGFERLIRSTGFISALEAPLQEQALHVVREFVEGCAEPIVVAHEAEVAWAVLPGA